MPRHDCSSIEEELAYCRHQRDELLDASERLLEHYSSGLPDHIVEEFRAAIATSTKGDKMPESRCQLCKGSGTVYTATTSIPDTTVPVPCPACEDAKDSPRYLAVYGAMVAAQVFGLADIRRLDALDDETMRTIVAIAHDVAKRSEDAQP